MNEQVGLPTAVDNGAEEIPVDDIRIDGGAQMRAGLDDATVDEYAHQMLEGTRFPPCVVFHDGKDHWMADGFHRIEAWRRMRKSLALISGSIECDVRSGTHRDAILFAAHANAAHGLRRTNADKRRAVETMLGDDEWGAWSDREIARHCAVAHSFVGKIRSALTGFESSEERTYVTKHGTETTMTTTNIGKSQPEYRSVWQLEQDVRSFHRNMPFDEEVSHVVKYDTLVEMRDQGTDHPFWSELIDYLQEPYRKRDLQQALSNVIDQLRARAEQERTKAQELPPNTTATELPDGRWIAISDIRYLATDAWSTREEAIQAWHDGLTSREFKLRWTNVFTLRGTPTRLFSFIEGLKQATEEALTLALTNLPEENNEERFRLLTDRLIELTEGDELPGEEDEPDVPQYRDGEIEAGDRKLRIVRLRELYLKTLNSLEEFTNLTGHAVNTLPIYRGLREMLQQLEENMVLKEEPEETGIVDTAQAALQAVRAIQADVDEILAPV